MIIFVVCFICIYLFKVQSSIASTISAIAHWDWPENWPHLIRGLVSNLSSNIEWEVQAILRLLTEISLDLTDMRFDPDILSRVCRIFGGKVYATVKYILVIHFANFYVK
jgi:hypothetical protein